MCQSMLIEGFDQFSETLSRVNAENIPAGTEEMLRLLNHNEVDVDSHFGTILSIIENM